MSLRFLLFLIILIFACKFSNKNDSKQVEEANDLSSNVELYNFKIYPHLDSLKIMDYISSAENGQAILPNPNLFLYRDKQDKIRIAIEKKSSLHTWEIFDAADYTYDAAIRLENFDDKGQKELVITSIYGMRPQSTMGNEYAGNTAIWDLDKIQLYFEIEHLAYSDDMGRNGENTFSQECKLAIQVHPLRITVLKDRSSTTLEENAECFKNEQYPKYYRLVGQRIIESTDNLPAQK